MKTLEVLLLLIMVCAGACSAAMDIRKGIVPNRWVAIAGGLAALVQAVYCSCFARVYAASWLINMVFADLFALLMYAAGLWAAGDVKLFMILYACVPGRLLDGGGLAFSIVPYLYIFIPAMIWIAADTIWHTARHEERFDSGHIDAIQLRRILCVMLEITSVQALTAVLFPAFEEQNPLFSAVLMLIYAYFCSEKAFMQHAAALAAHTLLLLLAAIWGGWHWRLGSMGVCAAALLLMLFRKWTSGYNYRRMPTGQVKAGMILSAASVLALRRSRVKGLPENAGESMAARLTQQQADALHRWEKSARGEPTVVVVRKIPFAILISVGFWAWMMVRIMG